MNEARQEELNREHKKVPPKTTNAALVSFESLMGSFRLKFRKFRKSRLKSRLKFRRKFRLKFSKHASRTRRFLYSMEWEGQNGPRLKTQILSKALVVNRIKAYVSII